MSTFPAYHLLPLVTISVKRRTPRTRYWVNFTRGNWGTLELSQIRYSSLVACLETLYYSPRGYHSVLMASRSRNPWLGIARRASLNYAELRFNLTTCLFKRDCSGEANTAAARDKVAKKTSTLRVPKFYVLFYSHLLLS